MEIAAELLSIFVVYFTLKGISEHFADHKEERRLSLNETFTMIYVLTATIAILELVFSLFTWYKGNFKTAFGAFTVIANVVGEIIFYVALCFALKKSQD